MSRLFLTTRYSELTKTWEAQWNINLARLNTVRGYNISVVSVEFPNLVYAFNEYNQNFSFTYNVTDYDAVIPEGNYSMTQLSVAMVVAIDALIGVASGITFTADAVTQKLIMTGSAQVFTFVDSTVSGDCYEELGLDQDNYPTAALTWTNTAGYPVILSGTQYIDLRSNLGVNNYNITPIGQTLLRVPTDVNFGDIVYYEPQSKRETFINRATIDEIRLELFDDRGNHWKLPPNTHVSLELEMTSVLEIEDEEEPPAKRARPE